MKLTNKINLIQKGKLWALPVFVATLLASCSMVNEDLQPCAPLGTFVDFIYDYNMDDIDKFDEHVGSVYLYVFDSDGYFYLREEKHKYFFKPKEDFTMYFPPEVLKPGETYYFAAVAQGSGTGADPTEDYKWFSLDHELVKGKDRIQDYVLRLYRDPNNDGFAEVGIVNYKDQYGRLQQMIDTLWTTRPDCVQEVPIKNNKVPVTASPEEYTHVRVPMMRITNAITVNVLKNGFDANTNVDDYHVVIHFPKGNGTIDLTGSTLHAQELFYQSLIKNMSPYTPKNYTTRASSGELEPDQPADTYCMKSLFGVSRLQLGDESSLQLRDATKEGNPIIYEIKNFSEKLAQMCNDSQFENDEFLDREYDFTVDISLKDDGKPEWIGYSISILGWGRREFFYDL